MLRLFKSLGLTLENPPSTKSVGRPRRRGRTRVASNFSLHRHRGANILGNLEIKPLMHRDCWASGWAHGFRARLYQDLGNTPGWLENTKCLADARFLDALCLCYCRQFNKGFSIWSWARLRPGGLLKRGGKPYYSQISSWISHLQGDSFLKLC